MDFHEIDKSHRLKHILTCKWIAYGAMGRVNEETGDYEIDEERYRRFLAFLLTLPLWRIPLLPPHIISLNYLLEYLYFFVIGGAVICIVIRKRLLSPICHHRTS